MIWFFGIYAILFASFAFVSKSRPDNDYRLILQNDSTLVESSVLVYSKIDIVEIKEFDKKLSIDEIAENLSITKESVVDILILIIDSLGDYDINALSQM